jgi:hypothetical protein
VGSYLTLPAGAVFAVSDVHFALTPRELSSNDGVSDASAPLRRLASTVC